MRLGILLSEESSLKLEFLMKYSNMEAWEIIVQAIDQMHAVAGAKVFSGDIGDTE